jgi:hypothetical protein
MRGCRCALLWPESYETLLSISGLPWRWDFLFRDRRAGTRCPVPLYSAADEFYRRRPFMAIPSMLSSGDVNASDQSFQVPLPWPHNSFVEVIQVENDLTLRSTIHSKVVQVPLPSITTRIALIGVVERSDAMTQADPRRKANGEAAIRPMRSGIRCSCRPLLLANTVATGSG